MNETGQTRARLLVVDDNPTNLDLLTRRLERLGHEVHAVDGGAAALSCLRAGGFDLVLLDVTMPGMDGYQVLEAIKADASLQHLPVIMVSALTEVDSVVRCLQLGAEDYLTKPFNPVLLRARIDSSLARKRLYDIERERLHALQRELEIGRSIQSGFLPSVLPQPTGWRIAARFLPARQVAGDFYDVFALANGGIALVVADVCDKGVGAALYMALFRSLIRALATHAGTDDPEQLLLHTARTTNDYIAVVHDNAHMFATAFVAGLDPRDGTLTYVNAGHDAPFLLHDTEVTRLGATGPALGMMEGMPFRTARATLAPGDRLFAFTDGVTEAGAPKAAFGEEGVLAHVHGARDPDEVLDTMAARLDEIGGERWDDVTMLFVRRGDV